jgi:hypothetical protein
VLQIFRDAPARWDETKCLIGDPGHLAVFARRSGKSWFIAGLNGAGNPTTVNIDLTPYGNYPQRFTVTEASDAKMQVMATPLAKADAWSHEIPARGGFIIRLDQ